jgi:hypothetical protein
MPQLIPFLQVVRVSSTALVRLQEKMLDQFLMGVRYTKTWVVSLHTDLAANQPNFLKGQEPAIMCRPQRSDK